MDAKIILYYTILRCTETRSHKQAFYQNITSLHQSTLISIPVCTGWVVTSRQYNFSHYNNTPIGCRKLHTLIKQYHLSQRVCRHNNTPILLPKLSHNMYQSNNQSITLRYDYTDWSCTDFVMWRSDDNETVFLYPCNNDYIRWQ